MPDYDAMTHEQLATYASWLRATGGDTPEEMEKMRVAARKRPQEITGTIGKVV